MGKQDHDSNGNEKEERREERSDSGHSRSDVCRDYLKNICNRGSRCKFYHPAEAQADTGNNEVHFCIDYQNRGCMRDNCRFVHVSRDEAERYKLTKEVTLPLARAIAAVSTGDSINGVPVCKEFQTGKCSRGTQRCRYWHVNVDEERERRRRGLPTSGGGPPGPMRNAPMGKGPHGPAPFGPGGPFLSGPMASGPFGPGIGMRRPLPADFDVFEPKRPRMDEAMMRIQELEKKNAEYQKEIEGLKREVQREHERYEDLYALFRQQTSQSNAGASSSGGASAAGMWGLGGGWTG